MDEGFRTRRGMGVLDSLEEWLKDGVLTQPDSVPSSGSVLVSILTLSLRCCSASGSASRPCPPLARCLSCPLASASVLPGPESPMWSGDCVKRKMHRRSEGGEMLCREVPGWPVQD